MAQSSLLNKRVVISMINNLELLESSMTSTEAATVIYCWTFEYV